MKIIALYNKEITLIKLNYKKDEIGQEIENKNERKILCDIKSISKEEFYKASQIGLKPSINFIINYYEYEGEEKVIFEDKEYKIIRIYKKNKETVELYCEVQLGG